MLIIYVTGIIGLSLISTIAVTSLMVVKSKNKELLKRVSSLDEAANESYVKFISDSRDWAYAYIEEVQGKILDFSNKVEPQLNYFNTYGRVVPSPHSLMIEKIDEAYRELKTVLPEDNKEK